jgi:hypothetical protein
MSVEVRPEQAVAESPPVAGKPPTPTASLLSSRPAVNRSRLVGQAGELDLGQGLPDFPDS